MEITYGNGRDLYSEFMGQGICRVSIANGDCIYETCTDLTSESAYQIRCPADMIEMTMCQQYQIYLSVRAQDVLDGSNDVLPTEACSCVYQHIAISCQKIDVGIDIETWIDMMDHRIAIKGTI